MPMQSTFPERRTLAWARGIRNFMVGADGITGAAMVEFAVFVPAFAFMVVYLLDFGFYTFRQMEVQHAAQAGAQYAIAYGGYPSSTLCPGASCPISLAVANDSNDPKFPIIASPAPVEFCGCPSSSGVTQIATGKSACSATNTGSCPIPNNATCSGGAGTYVTVSAQGTYTPLVAPLPGGLFSTKSSYTLSACATVRVQ
jgi:TadE-like protein